MRFSLLLELQIADPTPQSEVQLFHDVIAEAVRAEELGYDGVWAVEHHGLYEYSHSSAPEVLLAFLAAKTRRLRLGHGVTLTPHRYNHPIRVAERIATLDVLSGGRVDWGSGKSTSRTEQGAFQVRADELDGQWREAIDIIPRMWRSDVFEHRGAHYDIPPTMVVPKPVQQPHPPVFAACSRAESVVVAGELGVGSLNFSAGDEPSLRAKVQSYRAALSRYAGARPKTERFLCTPTCLVLDDDRRACEIGLRGARFFTEGLATAFFSPARVTGPLEVSRDPLGKAELDAAMRARGGGSLASVIGDPTFAREQVARFAGCGVDELILVMQMGTVPHEVVLESLRTFAEQVMPAFR